MKIIGNGTSVKPKTSNLYQPSDTLESDKNVSTIGSIFPQRDWGRLAVNWYCSLEKRSFVITRYNKLLIPITCYKLLPNNTFVIDDKGFPIPDRERCHGYKIAQKLLAAIQGRWEREKDSIGQSKHAVKSAAVGMLRLCGFR